MDRTERERAFRPERVKRLIYAGVSSALTIIAVWRAAVLLINNTRLLSSAAWRCGQSCGWTSASERGGRNEQHHN